MVGFGVYFVATNYTNDALISNHCRTYASENTKRKLDQGYMARDKASEQETYELCLEQKAGSTVYEILFANDSTEDSNLSE